MSRAELFDPRITARSVCQTGLSLNLTMSAPTEAHGHMLSACQTLYLRGADHFLKMLTSLAKHFTRGCSTVSVNTGKARGRHALPLEHYQWRQQSRRHCHLEKAALLPEIKAKGHFDLSKPPHGAIILTIL